MEKTSGTPQTLDQAIANGLIECSERRLAGDDCIEVIQMHVQDFLAQRFTVLTTHPSDDVSYMGTVVWAQIIKARDKKLRIPKTAFI